MASDPADLPGRPIRIGLDVGGTKTDAVALSPDGDILGRLRRPTGWGPEAVVQGVLETIAALAEEVGFATADIRSVGVGIPGLVHDGVVLHAVNLGVASLDIPARAGAVLGARFSVENDVKAAALGAASLRAGDDSMAYLNLGTGVAAGIIVGGRIWRGAHGTAG
ncbi:MAG: ROK family protein, partial [Microbacterium sp.]